MGGLGGLAQKYDPSQSASTLVASRDAEWEAAAGLGDDRRLEIGAVDQPFDGTGVEQASMERHLPPTNRGYMLLKKMGWREQTGLGRQGEGRVDPVRVSEQYAQLGLGKATEYEAKADEATESRKAMTAELIAFEDEAAKRQREEQVAREETIREKLREETDVFYCEVCDKRYVRVMEFENHLSSYDHHHRKRFKEMREAERARTKAGAPPKKVKKDPALVAAEAAAAAAAASATLAPPPPPPPPPFDAAASAGVAAAAAPAAELGSVALDEQEKRRRKLEAWKAQQAAAAATVTAADSQPPPAAAVASDASGAAAGVGAQPPRFGGMSLGGGKAVLGSMSKPGAKLGAGLRAKSLSKTAGFSVDDADEGV